MMITEKGQVTIPKSIRDSLGFLPGTEVEFVVTEEGHVRLTRSARTTRGRRIVEHLRAHRGDTPMSTDEILALTRDA
ncbi:MAG: AbrB/MazE/SpoVT family DNA-binding domain-containing protein [Dermatophilus congolensis]|nr:AbrB/MazE/SpoVT family DNA-binding domain-containing protein [Dermatophilus congolensis]